MSRQQRRLSSTRQELGRSVVLGAAASGVGRIAGSRRGGDWRGVGRRAGSTRGATTGGEVWGWDRQRRGAGTQAALLATTMADNERGRGVFFGRLLDDDESRV
ncbi:unnamed protein product [Linum trigynum]|uniref:Uncharacterized protein n=1 Tax=Linum trigynum TaxID=586398 RepID=A0AAV2EC40_9ROSI